MTRNNKAGRPKSENPKDNTIRVRTTKSEKEELNRYCKDNGISKSDLIRELLFTNEKIMTSNICNATNTLINKKR